MDITYKQNRGLFFYKIDQRSEDLEKMLVLFLLIDYRYIIILLLIDWDPLNTLVRLGHKNRKCTPIFTDGMTGSLLTIYQTYVMV